MGPSAAWFYQGQLCLHRNNNNDDDKVINHPVAEGVAAAARLADAFDLTATTSLPLR